jgi:hypothetical protein
MVGGTAMRPLVHVVNDHGLPIAGSVAEALQLIGDIIRARLQLLSEMVRQRQPHHEATRIAAIPS